MTQHEAEDSSDGSYLDLSIEGLRESYREKAVNPSDVIRTVYSRMANFSDKAVWITLIDQDVALKRAQELSQEFPDADVRPALYGIPFSVKDSIDIAGMPTTLACPSYAYTATKTAPVVQRILDAGGILIGKTNLDQFATGLNGTRSPYGIPRCVRDPEYISGGSSSGGAASVGAHLVSFAVATDTAGSTRVPAALNGLVGLKPTLGTISTVGLVPACKTADCITIIAPTIETAKCALDVMQSYDEDDEYAREPWELACLAQQPSWFLSGWPFYCLDRISSINIHRFVKLRKRTSHFIWMIISVFFGGSLHESHTLMTLGLVTPYGRSYVKTHSSSTHTRDTKVMMT